MPENSVRLYHFAIEVEALKYLAAINARLKKAGVKTYTVNHGISKAVYFFDPDGNRIEIYLDTRDGKKNWKGVSAPLNLDHV